MVAVAIASFVSAAVVSAIAATAGVADITPVSAVPNFIYSQKLLGAC
jgi:hypothetical protein